MKIENRRLEETANVSAGRGTAFRELRILLSLTVLLVVVVYVVMWLAVDVVVAGISFETEARMFSALAPADEGDGEHAELLERPQRVLDKLVQDDMVPPLPYRIKYLPMAQTNAFAFPGGTIGVTKGLLNALDDDIELAFVIGHEIGHFNGRDHLRGMGRELGTSVVLAIIFGRELGPNAFVRASHRMLSLSYSRAQEKSADQYGVELVYRVYGKVDGVDRLFELLSDSDETAGWAYMFSSHPSPRKRISALKEYAAALPK